MDNLRESLGNVLPILLLMLVILGDLMVFATGVFPALQEYNDLNAQLTAANVALSQQSVEQIEEDPIGILNSQIERLQTQIAEIATVFLTDNQGDSILDRLYAYSDESGVDITNLQLQQSPTAPTEDGPSSVRQFRVQVAGPVARLMNYIMRIRGAVLPTLQLTNLSITETNGEGLLTMDVSIYVSPYSDGAALDNLPPVEVPPPPMPTPTPIPPEPTPDEATPVAQASDASSDPLLISTDAGAALAAPRPPQRAAPARRTRSSRWAIRSSWTSTGWARCASWIGWAAARTRPCARPTTTRSSRCWMVPYAARGARATSGTGIRKWTACRAGRRKPPPARAGCARKTPPNALEQAMLNSQF